MFYANVERIIKQQGIAGLIQLEFYYGLELELSRQSKDSPYSKVYGRDSGQPGNIIRIFKGILQSDDFFESNTTQTPAFVAGFLYSREKDLLVADIIKIVSTEDRDRRYRITAIESIGLTKEVFKRYKISSLGG